MALIPSTEAVLHKMNTERLAAHDKAVQEAKLNQKPAPPKPELLKPEQVEFPKYLHKDWKESSVGSHHVPGKSELALNAEQEKELLAKGYSALPPKKEDPKKDGK